ncbi:MAG: hypothetical protein ABJA83_12580 [Burkholderiaceae bacterium]
MMSDRIIRLCKHVELLACELDRWTARGQAGTARAVLLRMKLAAMTADLVAGDLIERLQDSASQAANSASEETRASR